MKENDYSDIIHMPHPTSVRHARMKPADRAAQFSPFAALTGHSAAIQETARTSDRRIELSEDERVVLDRKLAIVEERAGSGTHFKFTCFVPDTLKSGGAYVHHDGSVSKVDLFARCIVLKDHTVIDIDQIMEIESEVFDRYE